MRLIALHGYGLQRLGITHGELIESPAGAYAWSAEWGAALAFLLPFGLEGAAYGNVQPLLVLALLWGAPRRSGPIWVALAASLKLDPILLVVVYAGRGEWARAAWTLAITAALVLPMLAFDLSGYSRDIGAGRSACSPSRRCPSAWWRCSASPPPTDGRARAGHGCSARWR